MTTDSVEFARPPGRPSIVMQWHNLAFLHWPVPAAHLRPLVPAGLEIDTFDGTGWVGLVPFTMRGVRHASWPPMPTMHHFHECNVRTYVKVAGVPGVWFFSLDAVSRLAVFGARRLWDLNYHHARIDLRRDGDTTRYEVQRRADPSAHLACRWEAGAPLPRSRLGSLEYFLTERYALYSCSERGRVRRGRIWHDPWSLRAARLLRLEDNLVAAAGVSRDHIFGDPICWHAERVDASAWRPRPV